jgi:hypothetical protein
MGRVFDLGPGCGAGMAPPCFSVLSFKNIRFLVFFLTIFYRICNYTLLQVFVVVWTITMQHCFTLSSAILV